MAAPTTPVLDDFNTGANQLLTARAGWSTAVLYGADTSFTTDAGPTYATGSTAAEASNKWVLNAADSEAFFVLATGVVGTHQVQTRLTGTGATLNGYELSWTTSTGVVTLFKIVNQVETSLGTYTSQAAGVGDTLCLQTIGTAHQAWYKASGGSWVSLGTIVDGVVTGAGDIGFLCGSPASRVDAFGGGAVVTALPRNVAGWITRSGGY